MTDDDTKHRLAMGFVAGVRDGDFDQMRSVLAPTATWSVPGETGISGVADGADAIIERARAVHDGGVAIDLQHVHYGIDDVAVSLHNTGQRGDVHLDEQVIIHLTLADGLIVGADNLITDVPGLNAFFAAGS